MSHLNALVVGNMGLLADIPNKGGNAILVRIDLQPAVLEHSLSSHIGREWIESVELCADNFHEILEHIVDFRVRRALQ